MSFMEKLKPNNVGIWPKLGLMMALMAVPMLVVTVMTYRDRSADAAFFRNEAKGSEYVVALNKVVVTAYEHHARGTAVLGGDSTFKAKMDELRAEMDANFEEVAKLDKASGKAFKTGTALKDIQASWDDAKASIDTKASYSARLSAHDSVVNGALDLMRQVGNESGLLLDPEIDTLNAILAAVDSLPRLNAYSNTAHATNEHVQLNPTNSAVERQRVIDNIGKAQGMLELAQAQYQASFAKNDKFAKDLGPKLETAVTAQEKFLNDVRSSINNTTGQATRPDDEESQYAFFDLVEATEASMVGAFESRESSAKQGMYVAVGGLLFALIAGLGIALYTALSIIGPVKKLVQAAERIAVGNLNADVEVHGANELGQLADSLRKMQASLHAAFDRLRRRAA